MNQIPWSAVATEELAHLKAQAWPELARYYFERAQNSPSVEARVQKMLQFAEVAENELHQPQDAQRIYVQILEIQFSKEAVSEAVRLMYSQQQTRGIPAFLQQAFGKASDPKEKSQMLALLGDFWRKEPDLSRAESSYQEALKLDGSSLSALVGLAEVKAAQLDVEAVRRIDHRVRTQVDLPLCRAPLFRRLAKLSTEVLKDPLLALQAWTIVLEEEPLDLEVKHIVQELRLQVAPPDKNGELIPMRIAVKATQPLAAENTVSRLRPSDPTPVARPVVGRKEESITEKADETEEPYRIPPSVVLRPGESLSQEREVLFERVQREPLEPGIYYQLADHFENASEPDRSSLMREVGRALEGDPDAIPRVPRYELTPADRAGLRHPRLRGEAGELMSHLGLFLLGLFPNKVRTWNRKHLFSESSGKGSEVTSEALSAAVRILGIRPPDSYVSFDDGPPFVAIFDEGPAISVGKLAIKKRLDAPMLRFFAGRALLTQSPELLALRTLSKEHVRAGLKAAREVLAKQGLPDDEKILRNTVPMSAWPRVKELLSRLEADLRISHLIEGARYSANRAGLAVCGGVAPVVKALRSKHAKDNEVIELIRFASSERYLEWRRTA